MTATENQKNRKPDLANYFYGKVPPQAPDIEEAVLGACLLERDAFDSIVDILCSEEIFYINSHQRIYRALLTLSKSGSPVDLVTVTEQLRKTGDLESIGGPNYLNKISYGIVSSAHIETHARLIYEKYMLREVIKASGAAMAESYEDASDVFDLLDNVQQRLQVIAEIPGATQSLHIGQAATMVMRKIYESRASPGHITGIPTGFASMDEKMYGFQKTELTILAARPSVGKTAFALNLAHNAVVNPYKKVYAAIFSLEMGKMSITERAMAFTGKVNLSLINRPINLTEFDLLALEEARRKLTAMGIFIDDTALITTLALRNKVRKLMRKHPDGDWIVFLDYLQLMQSTEVKGNREQQVSQISRGLKLLAKELNIPVVALSQLNRIDADDEPELSNLRESGAIEQDADNVMFLFEPTKKLVKENAYYANKVMLKGAKFRNGETFLLPLQFNKSFQLFTEPEREFKTMSRHSSVNFSEPAKEQGPEVIDDIPF